MPFNILRTTRSPGPDEIPAELIKYADESGAKVIQHLCNRIWKTTKKKGLLIEKIQLSLHFPKKVMSANAKTTEQLH